MNDESFDAIVVGYGPAGAVAAGTIAAGGHSVAIVERQPHLYPLPRMATFDGEAFRSIQALAGDGVDEAVRTSVVLDDCDFVDAEFGPLIPIDWSGRQCGFAAHSSVFQPDVERVAQEALARMPQVSVYRGTEVVGLAQDDEAVALTVRPKGSSDPATHRRMTARYVVGADGTNGFVRDAVGIEMTDYGMNEHWLNFDMNKLTDLPERFSRLTLVMDPKRPFMWMPLGTERQRFEFRVDPSEPLEGMSEPGTVWRFLAQLGLSDKELSICRQIVYPFATQVAKHWRKGRVLIAGDAAHTMTPYMGQGGCSAIRDGRNVGWKLDLVLSGVADPALLDLYQVEREPHVTEIVMRSDMLARLINVVDPVAAAERNKQLRDGDHGEAEPFPKIEGGVLHHESDGTTAAVTGTPAPQGNLRRGDRTGRGDEVLGHGFQLIARHDVGLDAGQRDAFRLMGGAIAVLDDEHGADHAEDVDGAYHRFLDDNDADFYLMRPDWAIFGVGRAGSEGDHVAELLRRAQVRRSATSLDLSHAN